MLRIPPNERLTLSYIDSLPRAPTKVDEQDCVSGCAISLSGLQPIGGAHE